MLKGKRVLGAIIVVLIAVAFFGCSRNSKSSGGPDANVPIKLACSVPTLDNPYFIQIATGFTAKCKELGVEAVVNDCSYDAAEQYTQFENYIEMGVKGIYVCPVDQKSLQEITNEAKSKGIPVVGFAQGIDNATSNFIVNDYDYGVANGTNAATWINEKLGAKPNYY
jgi:ABC-type sugar transport system substrate-binding protein